MANAVIFGWKWNVRTGYREFQRQVAVEELLVEAGQRIADAAGGADAGMVVEVQSRSGRRQTPRVAVLTGTVEAQLAEATDRVLTRALDAGRT